MANQGNLWITKVLIKLVSLYSVFNNCEYCRNKQQKGSFLVLVCDNIIENYVNCCCFFNIVLNTACKIISQSKVLMCTHAQRKKTVEANFILFP